MANIRFFPFQPEENRSCACGFRTLFLQNTQVKEGSFLLKTVIDTTIIIYKLILNFIKTTQMEDKEFIVNIGPNGTFEPSRNYQTSPSDVDEMFAKIELEQRKEITLFFHGGLVSETNGLETARKMQKHISRIDHFPICFVWETGLIETIGANIHSISETQLFNKLVKILIKKLSAKLGFEVALGKGPGIEMSYAEIDTELQKARPFENYNQNKLEIGGKGIAVIENLPKDEQLLLQDLEADFTYAVQSDFEIPALLAQTELPIESTNQAAGKGIISTVTLVKHIAKIAFRVIKRFVQKRDHDFYPTVIEEILRELYVADLGAWVWLQMKEKSNKMWQENSHQSGVFQYAGRYVLDKILAYNEKVPDLKVNLVGHSAGSIAICHLLNETAKIKPDFVYHQVSFMAPACRIELFHGAVVKHPERFKRLRIFTMSDTLEKADSLVPYFYTHSLLYFISGVLEDKGESFDAPILGLERNLQAQFPYDNLVELIETNQFLFEQGKNRLVFSNGIPSQISGMKSNSKSHGGFDDDLDTIESLQFMLKENLSI